MFRAFLCSIKCIKTELGGHLGGHLDGHFVS